MKRAARAGSPPALVTFMRAESWSRRESPAHHADTTLRVAE
jgi:hypothetical protein